MLYILVLPYMHMVFNAEAKIEMVRKVKVEIGEATYGSGQKRGIYSINI